MIEKYESAITLQVAQQNAQKKYIAMIVTNCLSLEKYPMKFRFKNNGELPGEDFINSFSRDGTRKPLDFINISHVKTSALNRFIFNSEEIIIISSK